jgi:hypothetical protein
MAENSDISPALFVEAAAYLLTETFEGSPEGQGSAYLDHGVGFIPTLGKLTAAQASKDVGGTTIAAQTEHAKFYLDRLREFIGGRSERVDWEASWLIETVNDHEWDALRQTVLETYKATVSALCEPRAWTEPELGMAMGMIAHSAYHLGAIRQIVKQV